MKTFLDALTESVSDSPFFIFLQLAHLWVFHSYYIAKLEQYDHLDKLWVEKGREEL